MKWLKVQDQFPDYDEYVLWLYENGHIYFDCIDKDMDTNYIERFLNGHPLTGKVIYWCRPIYPKDMANGK